MKYGLLFLLLGLALLAQCVLVGGLWWLLAWPACSFLVVSGAYLGIGPSVIGKRTDGTLTWWSVLILWPYLLLTWLIWHVVRLTTKEACCNEVLPGFFIGRRPLAGEVPSAVTLLVDLTAEFPEVRDVRQGRQYVVFPMLDAAAADESSFRLMVDKVAHWPGPVYIHCAQGHGRTGTFAAAVLMAKGLCSSVEEALAMLRRARPQLNISRTQLAFLRRVCT